MASGVSLSSAASSSVNENVSTKVTPWERWADLPKSNRSLTYVLTTRDFEVAKWYIRGGGQIWDCEFRAIINSNDFDLIDTTFKRGGCCPGEKFDSILHRTFKHKDLEKIPDEKVRDYLIKIHENFTIQYQTEIEEMMRKSENDRSITAQSESKDNSINSASGFSSACASTSAVANAIIGSASLSGPESQHATSLTVDTSHSGFTATASPTVDQNTDIQTLDQLRKENERLKNELKAERRKNLARRNYLIITICVGVVAAVVGIANNLFFPR